MMDRRTRLLTAPVLPTLFRLAVPSIAAMMIMSSMSIVEAWYLGQEGTVELAGVALVFPIMMLSTMLSGGAVGGAVSGATANALGAGDTARAEMILRASVILSVGGGAIMAAIFLIFGRAFYGFLGGEGAVLDAAMDYSDTLMPGMILIWMTNMGAGIMRGAGDMVRPAVIQAVTAISHFVLCWVLIAEAGLGIAGAAWAMTGSYAVGLAALWFLFLTGRSQVVFVAGPVARALMVPLLKIGSLAGIQAVMTVVTALTVTALMGRLGPEWLAGYGIGARLEFLMIPVIFGIGASLIAMVGTNAGAGQRDRAISIAWQGTFVAAGIVGLIGLASYLAPTFWARQFTDDPAVIAATATYMRTVAPCYAFFGLGLCLYFASQSMQSLGAPVIGSFMRLVIIAGGGIALFRSGDTDPDNIFMLVATAMVLYGVVVASGLRLFAWRPGR